MATHDDFQQLQARLLSERQDKCALEERMRLLTKEVQKLRAAADERDLLRGQVDGLKEALRHAGSGDTAGATADASGAARTAGGQELAQAQE